MNLPALLKISTYLMSQDHNVKIVYGILALCAFNA